jgi:hypothetical protein
MTIETVLVKRKALYPGEVGFFPSNPVSEDDVSPFTMGGETIHRISEQRNIEQLKFLWGLIHKTADNTDRFRDKDQLMEHLKVRAGYYKLVWNGTKFEAVGKSLTRIDNEKLRLLTEQFIEIICEKIIPGMKANNLRREIEEMCMIRNKESTNG